MPVIFVVEQKDWGIEQRCGINGYKNQESKKKLIVSRGARFRKQNLDLKHYFDSWAQVFVHSNRCKMIFVPLPHV